MKTEQTFNGQRPEEKVLEVVMKHPYILYPPALRVAVVVALAIGLMMYLPSWNMVAIIIIVVALIYLFRAIYCFKETILIITDQRLFIVQQKSFFRRKITEIDLYKILDMTSETKGFARTLLKYGDLIVRTAGSRDDGGLVIDNIPDPYSVEQRIANLEGMKK
ncbi:MAG TPA: PH domain-containing protein [Patescibacteria group bacterium]|nr:PH domain-containing protein [Patescibacteria group bacterium]